MGLTSAHWGTYHAEVEDGRLKDMRPFEADLDPNEIGRGIIEVVDDKTRIIQPMVRKSWLMMVQGRKQI